MDVLIRYIKVLLNDMVYLLGNYIPVVPEQIIFKSNYIGFDPECSLMQSIWAVL